MSFVTTKDGTNIFYKDWDRGTRKRSIPITAGRSVPMTDAQLLPAKYAANVTQVTERLCRKT